MAIIHLDGSYNIYCEMTDGRLRTFNGVNQLRIEDTRCKEACVVRNNGDDSVLRTHRLSTATDIAELYEKYVQLHFFKYTTVFSDLPKRQQELINKQLDVMEQYKRILQKRLNWETAIRRKGDKDE